MADETRSNRRPQSLNDRHYRLLQVLSAPPKEKPMASSQEDVDDSIPQFCGITDFDSSPSSGEIEKLSIAKQEASRLFQAESDETRIDVDGIPQFSGITDSVSPFTTGEEEKLSMVEQETHQLPFKAEWEETHIDDDEEEKPSMAKQEVRQPAFKAESKETHINNDGQKPVKTKIQGRRRLCKFSSSDENRAESLVVRDEPHFSEITDFHLPPLAQNISKNNSGATEIRDILNDLSSRLEILSIEKKRIPKTVELVDDFSELDKDEVHTEKKDAVPVLDYASAESSFSPTDPSGSSSDATKIIGSAVNYLVDGYEKDINSGYDNSTSSIHGTDGRGSKKNANRGENEKLGSPRQSLASEVAEQGSGLLSKLESDNYESSVHENKKDNQRMKENELKSVNGRVMTSGQSPFMSDARQEDDDNDCVILTGKKLVEELPRHGTKNKEDSYHSSVVNDFDNCTDKTFWDECSITLNGPKSTFKLPGKIANGLYPHQREGLRWLWSLHCQDKGGILGDDMGLGKTMQICGFLAGLFHSRLIKRALIVAPKTLLPHWIKELSVVGLSGMTREYYGTCAKARQYELQYILQDKGVLLTTYDIVRNNYKSLCGDHYLTLISDDDITWDYMILDEGHLIKNPSTQRAKSLLEIPSAHRILISGTPIQNNLKELWALFNFCCPGLLGDKDWFKAKYERAILCGNEKNATDREKRVGSTVAKELRERIQPYFLRRLKSEVFNEDNAETAKLSKKNEIIVWLRLTACQRQLYEAFLNSEIVLSAFDGSPLAALTILKKICDHPLLLTKRAAEDLLEGMDSILNPEDASVAEKLAMYIADAAEGDDLDQNHNISCKISFIMLLLDNLIPEGHKVLIFSQTRKMLNIIQELVLSKGYNFLRIDGTTKASERLRIVNDFQEGVGAPIFLLTSQVGGLGLTLTEADRVIVVDPAWNPSTDNQSVDRAYRIGQKKDVLVYRLMTSGTIEEKIYRKQVFKGGLFKTATEHKEQTRYFSQQDLRELFSLPKEGFDVSLTQRQLHEEHDSQHKMDEHLEAHIKFLESQGIAGVSHHSLLYSKAAPPQVYQEEEEDLRREGTAFVGKSSSSNSLNRNVDGAQYAFNPKDIKPKKSSSSLSPSSAGKLTESEIKERINRLSHILSNKVTVSRLPDQGAKLQKQIAELNLELQKITIPEATDIKVINLDDLSGQLERVLNV
ncbi:DNA excision repair protein ERCC-6-like isoform X1 [Tripterygium wilfordii]|uniref:DNA excision repair protein ERCC-6-like isoform X1 n=1 Tax=Tripterygium wilfordii TaxID=458696 RepID=A0A7J7DZS4_TRIWF|nr:protein CHROMATIN REMODELING 24 [Tripterygium wilfordii]KAF5751779.1 DNA excision repair protein ERCC-6-like isoform X1 [Tripterygium wilfordii]